MQIHTVQVEPLTKEAFSPYGHLLEAGSVPDFARPDLENWRLPFDSDAPLRLQVMRYAKQDRQLSLFERHLCVTEARAPISEAAAILVVAGDPANNAPPARDTVRAFFLDGSVGVMFHKGVWHGLDCFPARTSYVDYLFLSDTKTEDEIEASQEPRQGMRTELFDFADQNLCFQITDPNGVLA